MACEITSPKVTKHCPNVPSERSLSLRLLDSLQRGAVHFRMVVAPCTSSAAPCRHTLLGIDHLHSRPAIDDEIRAGDEPGRIGRQEKARLLHVLRPTHAPRGMLLVVKLAQGRLAAGGALFPDRDFDPTGADGFDADVVGADADASACVKARSPPFEAE